MTAPNDTAALPERAPVSAGGVDDLIALLGAMQTERTVLLHFSDSAQSRIRDGLSALTGYLSGLETLVHRITGEEGEDDALDVLQRYAEQLESTPAPPVGADLVMVPRDDLSLAAQMLTWGNDEGMTPSQERDVSAHQRKLFAMLATPATADVNHPQYEAGFKAGMRFEAKHRFFPDGATPAEARGVGDGVTELVAKWRKQVRTILGQGPSGAAMLQCAADLEAALAANKPAGEEQ